jgi:hypothetical protein
MKLTAIKTVRYGGKRYEPGEEFEAEGRWADLMQRAGIAQRLSEGGEAPRKRRGRPPGSTNKVVTNDTNVTTDDLVQRTSNTDQDDE